MMHKKHYEKAAEIVRQYALRADATFHIVQNSFIELFESEDSRFDRKRFQDACEPRCDSMHRRFRKKGCTKAWDHKGKCS